MQPEKQDQLAKVFDELSFLNTRSHLKIYDMGINCSI